MSAHHAGNSGARILTLADHSDDNLLDMGVSLRRCAHLGQVEEEYSWSFCDDICTAAFVRAPT